MDGILVVYKEQGMTSRDVVNQVGKILHTKKIGHTGTLDPMASGVLVLCVGKATKLVELLTSVEKEYVAEVTLGMKTDTLDVTGTVLEQKEFNVTELQIKEVLSSMIGTYEQEVPLYSAIHVNGKKLYEYARKGEEVRLPKKKVTISKLDLIEIKEEGRFSICTTVSKGTYIRSLVRDIAFKLGTIGVMSQLNRTKQGDFTLSDTYTLEQIKSGNFVLLSILEVLKKYKTIVVDEELEQKIKYGQLLRNNFQDSVILFVNQNQVPLALYQVYEKNKEYLKPWKMF